MGRLAARKWTRSVVQRSADYGTCSRISPQIRGIWGVYAPGPCVARPKGKNDQNWPWPKFRNGWNGATKCTEMTQIRLLEICSHGTLSRGLLIGNSTTADIVMLSPYWWIGGLDMPSCHGEKHSIMQITWQIVITGNSKLIRWHNVIMMQ